MSEGDDDKVGYRRPPKKSQFQKGRSGNPSGKARKPASLADDVSRVLKERVTVTKDGRTKRMRKGEVLAEQLVNKGLTQSLGAAKLTADLERQAREARRNEPEQKLSIGEEEILAELIARIRNMEA